MMEESNRNRVSIPGKGKEIFSSANYEAGRDVHSASSSSLGNHFSSTEGKEAEGEARVSS
jgi:hypothetical protein